MSSPSIYLQNYNNYYTMGAFAAGVQNVEEEDNLSSTMMLMGGFTAVPYALKGVKAAVWDIPKWSVQNFGHYREGFKNLRTSYQASKDAAKLPDYLKGKHWWNTVNNKSYYDALKEFDGKTNISAQWNAKKYYSLEAKNADLAKIYAENFTTKIDCYNEARLKLFEIKNNKLKGKELRKALDEVQKLVDKGDLKVLEEVKAGNIKATSRWGKFCNGVKKFTGYNKYQRGVLKCATTDAKGLTGVAAKGYAKFAKGGGVITTALGLGLQSGEIYDTYKQLGVQKGTKQLGKAATVAVAEGAGWVVGAKVGSVAGAKAGAAIGTLIGGPIGTAVGGFVGALAGVAGGLLVSHFAGKYTKKLTGKTELEKAKEHKADMLAHEAAKSEEGKQRLKGAVEAKIKEEIESTGQLSDETIIDNYNKYFVQNKNTSRKTKTKSKTKSGSSKTSSAQAKPDSSKYDNTFKLLELLQNYSSTNTQANYDWYLSCNPQVNIFGM